MNSVSPALRARQLKRWKGFVPHSNPPVADRVSGGSTLRGDARVVVVWLYGSWYIGLRGEGTKNQRKAVANAVYEAVPQLKDHRLPSQDGAPSMLL
jgi:hypothetical protein